MTILIPCVSGNNRPATPKVIKMFNQENEEQTRTISENCTNEKFQDYKYPLRQRGNTGIPENYDGLTPQMVMQVKFKSKNLIGSAGFIVSDQNDIESELAWRLRQSLAKYDSSQSKLMSFVNVVLKSKIANMIEARKTSLFDFRDHAFSLDEKVQDAEGSTCVRGDLIDADDYRKIGARSISPVEEIELRLDIKCIMAGLPMELKNLCDDIIKFGSIADVSKHTGTPRGTLYDRINKLKIAFRAAGFEK
ncbi:MAG: hypothetical protein NT018_00125 [Armatimonadetes bacterium]|nr:hypothetical protein [Armatimonadota bacterium]